jgi:O-antigen/teichoic acid export membrane protein
VATATRVTLLLGFAGCLVLGGSSPWWIVPLFGREFDDAVVPTLLLFLAAVLYIPGPMAGAGLASSGRPGLRSIGFLCTFVVNVVVFVLLVPRFGVLGACWASIASSALQSAFMLVAASRVLRTPVHHFLVPRSSDLLLVWHETLRMGRRVVVRAGE